MYHEGELDVQRKAGVADLAARVGRIIGGTIPPVAARFIEARTLLIASTIDDDGRVRASPLAGAIHVDDERTLRITCGTDSHVCADRQECLSHIGLLAIDFTTRRRMRVNGIARHDGHDLVVTTREVYSNCPQFIHPRPVRPDTSSPEAWVRTSDTFFLATAHPQRGADASHRGGDPGFVTFDGTRVVFTDYSGNNLFNSLGNLAVNPNCGLLFVDFESGATLQLSGRGRVEWEPERRVVIDVSELRSEIP
jgi:predicted pyridoxine 5'-phosphate oxidase superfamily flavin-nucleotide-binding protein